MFIKHMMEKLRIKETITFRFRKRFSKEKVKQKILKKMSRNFRDIEFKYAEKQKYMKQHMVKV